MMVSRFQLGDHHNMPFPIFKSRLKEIIHSFSKSEIIKIDLIINTWTRFVRMHNFPDALDNIIPKPWLAEKIEDIGYSRHDVHLGVGPEGVLARDGSHPEDLERVW